MVAVVEQAKGVMRNVLGHIAGTAFYEKLVATSAMQHQFRASATNRMFPEREALWDHVIATIGADTDLTYLEFGVWKGYSIGYFSEHFTNPHAEFLGFDSFEGLPEDWFGKDNVKGVFSTNSIAPDIRDPRVSFVKGWFQNTITEATDFIKRRGNEHVFVHYDADLYSSTLFLLCEMHHCCESYYAVFDEFYSHECRALLNYISAYGAGVEFLGMHRSGKNNVPAQTFVKITTNRLKYTP